MSVSVSVRKCLQVLVCTDTSLALLTWFHVKQVERRHLEEAVDERIKTLGIAGSADGGPPATSDDLQVCEQYHFVIIPIFPPRNQKPIRTKHPYIFLCCALHSPSFLLAQTRGHIVGFECLNTPQPPVGCIE